MRKRIGAGCLPSAAVLVQTNEPIFDRHLGFRHPRVVNLANSRCSLCLVLGFAVATTRSEHYREQKRVDVLGHANGEQEPQEAAATGSRMRAGGTGCLPLAQCFGWAFVSSVRHYYEDEKRQHSKDRNQ